MKRNKNQIKAISFYFGLILKRITFKHYAIISGWVLYISPEYHYNILYIISN